jgi:hypothetical protein
MWIERLAWAATILVIGSLPALWLILKGITWYDHRRGIVDDEEWGSPPPRPRVEYRRL